jgi:hypothetical protein
VVSAVGISAAAARTVIGSSSGGTMDRQLSDLVEKMKTAFGGRLVSVVLYGSAAMGDWDDRGSDLNVLCVLDRLSPAELSASEPTFRWWREKGNPPPLLLTQEEVSTSTDCFPMEFQDMREHRRVLYGWDLIADLQIDRSFYRAQVEHELRAKQIRLRQKAAEALPDAKRLTKLLTDSISTFCVLGRHALLLSGNQPRWAKPEILASLETVLRRPLRGANAILSIRISGEKNAGAADVSTLENYLGDFDALVRFVDALDK